MIRHERKGADVKRCAEEFPSVEVESSLQPITRTILRIRLTIHPTFKWNDRVHGKISENFWVWIEDPDTNRMYHHEYLLLTKKQVITREPQELVATIPLMEPIPSQYLVRIINDRWLGSEDCHALTFQHLILPDDYPPHTDLLPLQPLPITALQDTRFQSLYSFSHFNPIQTQVFHCLYHSDENVVLGAPTGSGKTLVAELAMFRVFKEQPGAKVVYIAPMKALVRERVHDWGERLGRKLGRKVVELTGDATPDARAIAEADVVVTTPEKWDGVSRSWQTRGYVRQVGLLVIDEIHLLGEERGPVLEVIVSRANFIAAHAGHQVRKCRVVGLSTALANAGDLAQWLKITSRRGMYNFRPSVRPVPLSIHIQGFPGKHYCPRMATMNKPTFQAVRQHSPNRPALVFVSSRRQTRLTGMDLISYLAAEDDPKQWLHMPENEAENIAATVTDPNLRLLLPFGIGIHHAGLKDHDRSLVEELFVSEKIQVLIATATLAWGVNFPAHLVVVKGTEYFDGKQHRYVDMPITDVLQMMGRAGRPQFDETAVAVVLVHDAKKNFYKKFLHEPFPVESSLLGVLPDHINAEIVAGVIQTRQEALEYLTWTYFFRRLLKNPSYYKLVSLEAGDVNGFLSSLVEQTVVTLQKSNCITELEDGRSLEATCLGRIASYYYLSHKTLALFEQKLDENTSLEMLVRLLSDTAEYAELPVRHNEDGINLELSKQCPYKADPLTMDSPHTKAFLLFQAHISRQELPSSDYYTDLKSVLDQAIRIIQAMVDVCAEYALLATTLRALLLLQGIVQAAWPNQTSLCTLPYVEPPLAQKLSNRVASTLPELQEIALKSPQEITSVLSSQLNKKECQQVGC
ncbi:hypothetical protein B566_EDAN012611 [Ephemera danica]|nr:hypothetical protein B566_EDAN012611 [Ephemera danica]